MGGGGGEGEAVGLPLPEIGHRVYSPGCSRSPPQITLRPRNQQVKDGGIAIFYCAASGDPQPELQWRKNGKKLPGTQSRYLVQNFPEGGTLLRIEPVRISRDSVVYECAAENGVGDAITAEASLKVYKPAAAAATASPSVNHANDYLP
ncbi:UNVERIFIED_CONTAM: hypothetical protein PYX00_008242 [Menopon gallinae]|uniref:Ig-like domain-containing protein n=1 Tax=Menopon gallinae TaxID=328185 RepID=A0AAW2HNH9_9NEOP